MYDRILVPLDGTTFSEQALALAVSLARRSGAGIRLAMVDLTPIGFPAVEELPPMPDLESNYLKGMVERVQKAGIEDVTSALLVGEIVETLEHHRKSIDASLTIMSTHGRGPLRRAWLGNVADRFTRATAAPVILMRPVEDEDAVVDLESDRLLGRIMITLDGSALSESAIAPAIAVGRWFDAEYLLTRFIRPIETVPAVYIPHVMSDDVDGLARAQKVAEGEVEAMKGRLGEQGLESEVHVGVVGHIAQGIIDLTNERSVDLLVMAAHGHGGLTRLLMGSVTDKVLRGGDVPLMIIPSGMDSAD